MGGRGRDEERWKGGRLRKREQCEGRVGENVSENQREEGRGVRLVYEDFF